MGNPVGDAPERILYITNRPPYPQDIGGNQRTDLLRRALAQLGPVDLALCISPGGLSADHEAVLRRDYGLVTILPYRERGKHFPWSLIRPLKPQLVDRLAHNFGRRKADYAADPGAVRELEKLLAANSYRCIVGRYLLPTVKSGALAYMPVVIDLDDVDTEVYRSRLKADGVGGFAATILRRHLGQLEALLPSLLSRFDELFVANADDRRQPGLERARHLPNIPYVKEGVASVAAQPDTDAPVILTVGSMSHGPNQVGVDRFLSESWSAVRAAFPEAEYRIVGSGIGDELRARWAKVPGVTVVGFAKDLAEEYRRCAFTVAPIYTGAGTNIKVVESLSYGRTAVLTPFAWRGFTERLLDGESVRIAHDGDLGKQCIELLRQPELRRKLAAEGKRVVDQHFSFAGFAEVVRDAVNSLKRRGVTAAKGGRPS